LGFASTFPERGIESPFGQRQAMHDNAVVEVQGITKRFAGHTAVQELSLAVPEGAVYGLLGPNGAGKTTTIRMIMNIMAPDEGSIRLFGLPRSGRDQSHRIGYLPEERGLYSKGGGSPLGQA
jgi:ABC-2 type transport system ATP-binding protein